MAGPRRLIPPPAVAPPGQGATFVELFFDLVFVFAVTQVTGLTAANLTWSGVAESVLVFWLIWWAWTQFTWSLNPADTSHTLVRLAVLVATGLAFLMALAVDDAFGDGGLWFAVPYVAVRVVGLLLYAWVAARQRQQLRAVIVFSALSSLGLVAALVGGAVDTPARAWFWVGLLVADLVAAGVAGGLEGWNVRGEHFAERHGLFVIIALGESMVVAGIAASTEELAADLVLVVGAAVALACLLWWTYFGWLKDSLEDALTARAGPRQTRLARDAYSFGHFPLIGGVIGIAVGIEEMVAHPDAEVETAVFAAFVVGLVLFVGSAAGAWGRAYGRVLWPRLALLAAMAAVLVAVRSADPVLLLVIACVWIAALVAAEGGGPLAPGETAPDVEGETRPTGADN